MVWDIALKLRKSEQLRLVRCSTSKSKNGVQTGRFDDEQLFYLMSRGAPEHDARRLVVRGFSPKPDQPDAFRGGSRITSGNRRG